MHDLDYSNFAALRGNEFIRCFLVQRSWGVWEARVIQYLERFYDSHLEIFAFVWFLSLNLRVDKCFCRLLIQCMYILIYVIR
jgi:hypothetical protein